ncbi:MAG TPA: sigma factor-like helix-turn-helix DNA-binding protein, partial [Gammaproteobacteria bacterium]
TQVAAQADLERALAMLSPLTRTVVWLHDVEGYTHAEIGRLMGRTTSFSKSQLARAHERLRELLEGAEPRVETSLCTPELKTC